ncbi:PAS domain-containing protein [Dethiobacter alkaliphilus]|uniref:PAS fold domain-containing protein n=1 Tax=Dethiobacter alkaliphilus AHT 1 TaxID=555088 RepID=C0GJP5_DETAL|nr:PAS domain-containing protein [Dethiobacter alkaliphilus]EEG76467.1 hypothetical protein DealDRAFT_2704 [Dethiobacter alkaliphilus AHT 1]
MSKSKRQLPVIQAEAVLQSLPEGTIVTDANATIRFINKRAAEIFAVDVAAAVGQPFINVFGHRKINRTIKKIN